MFHSDINNINLENKSNKNIYQMFNGSRKYILNIRRGIYIKSLTDKKV